MAFGIGAAVPIYYALRGGSYDAVVRQEEGIVLWLVLGLMFAFGLLPRARPGRGVLIPLAGLGLLAAWTALGLSWTQSDERTFAELARVLHLGGLALLGISLVDRTTWRPAAAGLAAGAILISSLAVASRLAPGAFPANEIKRALGTDRLNYPFNYWNALGAWSAMTVAMALAWSAHARHVALRAACAAVLPVCGLAIYMTYSRAGVIGGGLAVIVVLALARNRWMAAAHAAAAGASLALAIHVVRSHDAIADATSGAGGGSVALALLLGAAVCVTVVLITAVAQGERWRVPRPLGQIGLAALVLLCVVVSATAARHPIRRGWDEFRGTHQSQVRKASTAPSSDPAARLTNLSGTRYFEWRSALRAFDRKPFRGIGSGTFEFWWNRDDGREFVRDAHSLYFESLGELGVPGLLFVLVFLWGLAALAVRACLRAETALERGALVAPAAATLVFLFHAGVDWMWESTAVVGLAILSATVAIGSSSALQGRPRLPARIAVPAVAVVAILVQLPGLLSVSDIRDSQASAAAGDLAQAQRKANDAIDAEPWSASAYVQRALVEEIQHRLAAADRDLRKAIAKESTNWRQWLLLARVDAERGRVPASLNAYRHARRLRPKSSFFAQPKGPTSQ